MTRDRPNLNDHDLMRHRLNALYRHNAGGRMVATNEWDSRVSPLVHFSRTPNHQVISIAEQVPEPIAKTLEQLARQDAADNGDDISRPFLAQCMDLLSINSIAPTVEQGPAFRFDALPLPPNGTRVVSVDKDNAQILQKHLGDWLPDVPHRRPFYAATKRGIAVSVCASARISHLLHEAGVETAEGHRRKGYALLAVRGWAAAVDALGATPVYSTAWDNVASRRVAAALGLRRFCVDCHISQ